MTNQIQFEFQDNASVYDSSGEKLGDITHVVIDPRTHRATHIAIEKGFFFKEDTLVAVEDVARADDDEVHLKDKADNLYLPPFRTHKFVDATSYTPKNHDAATPEGTVNVGVTGYPRPMYMYPPLGQTWTGYAYPDMPAVEGHSIPVEKEHTPANTISLEQGARVISRDDDYVGNIAAVYTHDESGRVTHFVIEQGLLFKDHKLIPLEWVSEAQENAVYLGVLTEEIERLPAFDDWQDKPGWL